MKEIYKDSLIYVIDDQFDYADLLEKILNEEGYNNIKTFTDPTDFLAEVDKKIPDLILMDILMPKMNGYELCEAVLKDEKREHIPVIMITASSMETFQPLVKSFEHGAIDFVTKPINELELLARINAALKSEMRRQKLQNALDEIQELRGLLPICSYCKKVRTTDDYWQSVEEYFHKHSDIKFSHGVCPTCYKEHIQPQLNSFRKKEE